MIASRATASPAAAAASTTASRRLVSIDIVRGLAILWVITFHVWYDYRHSDNLNDLNVFAGFGNALVQGRFLAAFTGAGDVVLGLGYLGVPLFMMLSGLSLTLNAYRRPEPGVLTGYWHRFRRVLPVYWTATVLTIAVVALLAYLHSVFDVGSFTYHWTHMRAAHATPISFDAGDVWSSTNIVGWVKSGKLGDDPVGSMWFVPSLLQYYLIFPFALMLLRRAGPVRFALAAAVLTFGARVVFEWYLQPSNRILADSYLKTIFPLRGAEFFIGMLLGNLLARRRDEARMWLRSPPDTAGLVVIGVGLLYAALETSPDVKAFAVFQDAILNVGIALIVAPILFKAPGRLEISVPARALVALGVVSFTALIVNDQLRVFAAFLRQEDVPALVFWLFMVVGYVPLSALIAYPFAALFGLLPAQRERDKVPSQHRWPFPLRRTPPTDQAAAEPTAAEDDRAQQRAQLRAERAVQRSRS